MHEMEDEPYDPAADGFVFSTKEIEAARRLRDRNERAARAFDYCFVNDDDDE